VAETAAAWRVVAASVAGTSHLAGGLPCQDAHGWRIEPGDVLLVACADGAGSAARSDEGARLAVDAALAALAAVLGAAGVPADEAGWGRLLHSAFYAARGTVAACSAAHGEALRAFATTLSVAVASADWLAVGHNGDGFVVATDRAGALELLAAPARGDYANEVAFLTGPDGLDHVTIVARPAGDVTGLALSTDGLLRLALELPAATPHAAFFTPLFGFARGGDDGLDEGALDAELAEWLASPAVGGRTDDDKTLVLAVRR
jgi:hypothetical protein